LETQLIISKNLNYLSIEDLDQLTIQIEEVQKMNYSIQSKFKQKAADTKY
jgi:hypothetical protein